MRRISLLAPLASIALLAMPTGLWAQQGPPQERYIVGLVPKGGIPETVAGDIALRTGGRVGYVYEHALQGFSITMPRAALAGVRNDRRVAFVEEDRPVSISAQELPTGLDRIYAPDAGGTTTIPALAIDGKDDFRVDADVAVVDTGIDLEHPDLNVVDGTNCLQSSGRGPVWARSFYCDDNVSADDDHYHGTHVAGTIGALDNGSYVVGVAPGARLHAVKVLDASGSGYTSGIIAGIDWVVAHNPHIDVLNMSLGGSGVSTAYQTAIDNAVAHGVVVVVAAGNSDADANNYSPAFVPSAITVSALADFDGMQGGNASPTCRADQDDTLADFSNWGSAIDIAAPGVCITSTYPLEKGGLGTISGTSMAAPHVAGVAALLASKNPPASAADVTAIRNALVSSGNLDWTDDSGDGVKEPLLDISRITGVVFVASPAGGGTTNTPPTASFTHGACVAGQPCSFDAGGSSDPGGSIIGYAWDFGDGTTASGATASHNFAAAQSYNVTLTVTDNLSATGTQTQSVTVAAASQVGTPDACDGRGTSLSLTPSSTNQGKNWTAIVSALSCYNNDEVAPPANPSWSTSGSPGTACSSTGVCTYTLSGIRKTVSSVTFTLGSGTATVLKP